MGLPAEAPASPGTEVPGYSLSVHGTAHFSCPHVYSHGNACKEQVVRPQSKALRATAVLFMRLGTPSAHGPLQSANDSSVLQLTGKVARLAAILKCVAALQTQPGQLGLHLLDLTGQLPRGR